VSPPKRRAGRSASSPEVVAKPTTGNTATTRDSTELHAAYVVVVVSPYGQPRRRVYLSLHHATQAVQRAHAKGQPAHMVLCRLVPVTGDLGERLA
jgi:hypothetical protein